MTRVSWIQSGTTFRRMEGEIANFEHLKKGVYEVGCDLSGWYLKKTADEFTFGYKLYNLQRDFLDYIHKTYSNTTGNLGILFNGTRGTGKSCSAKILANELNLPIIIVQPIGDDNCGLISYLASFNFDCVLFFDEFEKKFNEHDCSILQIMDGVYTSEYRKVFLLTTNDLNINENLLSRPSRIRYVREFGNLPKEVVEEYLDDNLKVTENKEDLIDYIDTLTISTIDILKAIVEEVNIHGIENFLKIKNSFNVEISYYKYHVVRGCINSSRARNLNYNVEQFLKEVDYYTNRFKYEKQRDEALTLIKDSDTRDKFLNDWYEEHNSNAGFDYDTLTNCTKKWDHFKSGDTIGEYDDKRVITVDIKNKVIITETVDRDYLCFYYIENPNEKPSLYSSTSSISNAYSYIL